MSTATIDETEELARQPNLVRDVAAIGLAAITLMMTVAVVTRSAADPIADPIWPISAVYSPDNVIYPANETITNACGYWGALLVSAMFDALGLAAVLVIGATGGVATALLGVALGLVGALAAMRALDGLLFEVDTADPWVLLGVGAFLAVVALAATFLPARRAAQVDPMVALRAE